jgi:predicted flap endonuclease-1-like 5' DNA nuclease
MWPLCDFSLASALWLLGPLLLGILTAWWIWGGRRNEAEDAYAEPEAEPARFAAPPTAATPIAASLMPEPVVPEPVAPEPVAPVAFSAPPVAAAPVAPIAVAPVAAAPIAAAAIGLTAIGIPAAVGAADDLELIKGIGPKLNGVLNGLGVHRFDQIANWTAGDVDKVDDHLGAFKDRIGQEEWIPQAKLLAAGNHSEWQRIYGSAGGAAAAVAGTAAFTAIGIPAAVGAPDDLLQIKGIGPKLNELLISLGVRRFDQISAWGASDVAKVDEHLGAFTGRIERDQWIEQAGLLARGAIAEFEAKFGKLDSENR